ncbi:DUF1990 family protein [Saccharopolyspora hattusasensis]|uniref:DUF1990 family protein n=1 Tax=Saccharopolyspora hattusasensis TaxID=1128679 RepID=UPI003D991419
MRPRFFTGIDIARALRDLPTKRVNYAVEQVEPTCWNFDTYRHPVAREQPGPPEPGGPWEIACGLVRDYEFSVPQFVRAVYDRREDLLGRNMLLDGRFHGLHFHMGVRVTDVTDQTLDDGRVWGWAYETLEGHLERGKMHYEVVKKMCTGEVEFVITGYSQRDPALGPVLKLGWRLFGRRTQLRFYRACGARLRSLVHARLAGASEPPAAREGDIVLAPSDVRPSAWDRLAVRHHPADRHPTTDSG